ncbi:MAG: hypothetical protein IT292_10980 [Deltaproteobacteria bacterium]|nr:hypothetical protein [Deltaproteobacteria bacterium]
MKVLDYEKDYSPVAYRKQIELLAQQTNNPTDNAEALFEYAYSLERAGFVELAKAHYSEIIKVTEERHKNNPKTCSSVTLAHIYLNHGKQLFSFGRFECAREAFHRASNLLYDHLNYGVGFSVMELLAESLHWLARSQRKLGDYDDALHTYSKSVPLLRNLLLFVLPHELSEKVQIMFHTAVYGYSKIMREQKIRDNWSVQ